MQVTSDSRLLLTLLIASVVITAFHYTDNALFLAQYPGPDWFTPIGIVLTWVGSAGLAALSYWLYGQRRFWLAYACLLIYAWTGLSSPGHYLYPHVEAMSLKMHGLIVLDAIAGASIIGFIGWSILQQQKIH